MARKGRPPLAPNESSPTVTLHVRVPPSQFDATWQRARESRVTLAEWVRGALKAAGAGRRPRGDPE